MRNSERWIRLWLWVSGGALITAFLASLLPNEWMRLVHEEWLGMGTYPASPLVEYLSRSIALLYGFHGSLVLIASTDLHRFRPIIVFLGWLNTLFGVAVTVIDWKAGMPWYWTLGEGPSIGFMGVVLLLLLRGFPEEPRA